MSNIKSSLDIASPTCIFKLDTTRTTGSQKCLKYKYMTQTSKYDVFYVYNNFQELISK